MVRFISCEFVDRSSLSIDVMSNLLTGTLERIIEVQSNLKFIGLSTPPSSSLNRIHPDNLLNRPATHRTEMIRAREHDAVNLRAVITLRLVN